MLAAGQFRIFCVFVCHLDHNYKCKVDAQGRDKISIYIYIYICVCVCVCGLEDKRPHCEVRHREAVNY